MSHYHVWKFQEPEPGEFAFYRENEIHLSRATASRKRAAPDDIVRVCYAATPPTDARPNWAALCRDPEREGMILSAKRPGPRDWPSPNPTPKLSPSVTPAPTPNGECGTNGGWPLRRRESPSTSPRPPHFVIGV